MEIVLKKREVRSPITLTKEQVDEAFGPATEYHQAEATDRLYRLVLPDWDTIKSIKGWPKCGPEISKYILEKFIQYDQACHPDVMAGGSWALGNGWSSRDDICGWSVHLSHLEIEYHE